MTELQIRIDLNNSAFKDDPGGDAEVARILFGLARTIEPGTLIWLEIGNQLNLRDCNGNTVGSVTFVDGGK